jgi:hypothetical protein
MNRAIRSQDILILLKLLSLKQGVPWRQIDIAQAIGISQSDVTMALERSKNAGLYDASQRYPLKAALKEFLIHGLKYVFPAVPGALVRGVPTAHSAKPLSDNIIAAEQYVWPWHEGEVRGQSIDPLFKTVPAIVKQDVQLYALLALVDAIRVGRARERQLGIKELEKRIDAA